MRGQIWKKCRKIASNGGKKLGKCRKITRQYRENAGNVNDMRGKTWENAVK